MNKIDKLKRCVVLKLFLTHPKWKKYDILEYKINADFGGIYGQEFSFLDNQKPDSVMLAEGSKITVEPKSKVKY